MSENKHANIFDDDVADTRAFEKQFYQLDYLLADQNFKSEKALQKFVDEAFLHQEKWDELVANHTKTLEEQAQELLYDAFACEDTDEKVQMAKDAIKLFVNSPDAYNIMAEEIAETPKESLKYYKKGVEVGRYSIHHAHFENERGMFWEITKARPFMRSLVGQAIALFELGRGKDGIATAFEAIALDTSDHQGIRYELFLNLLIDNEISEADYLLKKFPKEDDFFWLHCKAYLELLKKSSKEKVDKAIKTAVKENPFVAAIMLSNAGDASVKKYIDESREDVNNAYMFISNFLQVIEKNTASGMSFLTSISEHKNDVLLQLKKRMG